MGTSCGRFWTTKTLIYIVYNYNCQHFAEKATGDIKNIQTASADAPVEWQEEFTF